MIAVRTTLLEWSGSKVSKHSPLANLIFHRTIECLCQVSRVNNLVPRARSALPGLPNSQIKEACISIPTPSNSWVRFSLKALELHFSQLVLVEWLESFKPPKYPYRLPQHLKLCQREVLNIKKVIGRQRHWRELRERNTITYNNLQ